MRWFPERLVPMVNGVGNYATYLGNAAGLVLPTFILNSSNQIYYLNLAMFISALIPLLGILAVQEKPKKRRNTLHTLNAMPFLPSLKLIFTNVDYVLCLLLLNMQIAYSWTVISLIDFLDNDLPEVGSLDTPSDFSLLDYCLCFSSFFYSMLLHLSYIFQDKGTFSGK